MAAPIDLTKFKNKRVLIIGDIILDEFVYTTSERNSPEYFNVPILNVENKKTYLGGAANVALNIKKLNAIPYLVGSIGNDNAAQTIYSLIQQDGISNQYIHDNPRQKTTVKTRVFKDGNPIFRMDEEENYTANELTNHFILKHIPDAINNQKPHVIILQDYNKGVLNETTITEIIALAQQHQIPICVDPKYKNWMLYKNVDLFKPNKKELKVMSDELKINFENLETNAVALQQKINFKNLLVTLGSSGNFIFDGDKSKISPLKTHLLTPDVCGAGDTVIAVASLGLASGFTLAQIAELANKAGFIVCQKENVQPITFEELEY